MDFGCKTASYAINASSLLSKLIEMAVRNHDSFTMFIMSTITICLANINVLGNVSYNIL